MINFGMELTRTLFSITLLLTSNKWNKIYLFLVPTDTSTFTVSILTKRKLSMFFFHEKTVEDWEEDLCVEDLIEMEMQQTL